MPEPGRWCPHPRGSHQARLRSSQGPVGVLVSADLGVPNGTPDVKDELIRKGKVTKPLIQGLGQLVWIPLVLPKLYHGGRWGWGSRMEWSGQTQSTGPGSLLPQTPTPPRSKRQALTQLCVPDAHVTLQQVIYFLNCLLLKGRGLEVGWEEGQGHHNNVNITLNVFTECQVSFCHFIYINPQFILRTSPTLSVLLSPPFYRQGN